MYMAPIVRAKTTAPTALRLAVGAPVLLLAALVMVPWLALNGLVSGAVLAGRTLAGAPRAMIQAADYAGQVALGR